MSFEVPPGPIKRSRRPILVPPLIAIVVVATALIAGPPPVPGPSEQARVAPTAPPLAATLIDCQDRRQFVCRETVRAAQVALGSDYPAIASATAWRSLICGDTLDCPPAMLTRSRPAGSVVFTFADMSVAWVNVVWVDVSSRRFEDGTERLRAYVVRWFAADS
jgi:hypothetical protein